jgi:hypothetical protein
MDESEENQIHLEERPSASGDRKWRAFTRSGKDYDAFGETEQIALQNFLITNHRTEGE